MTEEPEVPTEADAGETPPPDDTAERQKPTETVEFWKAKAREQEKRAKENAGAAKELATIKDADKSELQREREAREAAQQEAADLRAEREVDGWKAQVAKKSGLPAEVLRGSTLEDIEDHAASLKALLPESRRPGQVLAEGRTVTTGTGDPATQFASFIKRQLDGA